MPENGGVRELRLGVVLYGGVSLAIYMHGTTKEMHRLVKASALLDRGAGEGETASQRVYRDLLAWLRDRDEGLVRTRVVVDVIAGTSAGGINGIYLAKALAHDLSQDALRDVWLNCGDISTLLRGPKRIRWELRVPGRLLRLKKKSALDGELMSRELYNALKGMDDGGSSGAATLMPDGHELELFVTTTDFSGYDRDVVIGDPPVVQDQAHRHVLKFRHDAARDDFTRVDNGWLAFSARSTSSFPGAFPAVNVGEFQELVSPGEEFPDPSRFFRIYQLSSNATLDDRFFVDGGVLNNRPFDHVVRAIRERPADYQVNRKLVYLEPDPVDSTNGPKEPGPIATVLGSIARIPSKQPILDQMLELRRHNERVDRLQDIVDMSWDTIAAQVDRRIDVDLAKALDTATDEDLERWTAGLHEEAESVTGPAHSAYLRSKVSSVVERYSKTICELSDYPADCNQAAFVRSVVREWARERLFDEVDGHLVLRDQHVDFLRTFDLDYRERRLRFVIDAVSWLYKPKPSVTPPSRQELDKAKAALWAKRRELIDAMAGRNLGVDLTEPVRQCFGEALIAEGPKDPKAYVGKRGQVLQALHDQTKDALDAKFKNFGKDVLDKLQEVTEGWDPDTRKALVVRYLGFPIWDAILFPVQSVVDAGERDHVEVVRFSPEDAKLLEDVRPELEGMKLGHFGAFFQRDGRERDYLLGRLDGAERLIGILIGDDDADEEHRNRWCRQAFEAIVQEERDALQYARPLLDSVAEFARTD